MGIRSTTGGATMARRQQELFGGLKEYERNKRKEFWYEILGGICFVAVLMFMFYVPIIIHAVID
jgi:zinc transporter ZupT